MHVHMPANMHNHILVSLPGPTTRTFQAGTNRKPVYPHKRQLRARIQAAVKLEASKQRIGHIHILVFVLSFYWRSRQAHSNRRSSGA